MPHYNKEVQKAKSEKMAVHVDAGERISSPPRDVTSRTDSQTPHVHTVDDGETPYKTVQKLSGQRRMLVVMSRLGTREEERMTSFVESLIE